MRVRLTPDYFEEIDAEHDGVTSAHPEMSETPGVVLSAPESVIMQESGEGRGPFVPVCGTCHIDPQLSIDQSDHSSITVTNPAGMTSTYPLAGAPDDSSLPSPPDEEFDGLEEGDILADSTTTVTHRVWDLWPHIQERLQVGAYIVQVRVAAMDSNVVTIDLKRL